MAWMVEIAPWRSHLGLRQPAAALCSQPAAAQEHAEQEHAETSKVRVS
jgi:hypothetical protein